MNNIWCAYFVDMQLISRNSKEIRFVFCITDVFSKYGMNFL